MAPIRPPARNPCGSCPYRRDSPSGLWDDSEYEKLPDYDKPTGEQPPKVFMCHQQDGRMCAGWTACHDMEESFGIRMAVLMGRISEEDLETIFDYTTPVPVFESGGEAAAHGLRDLYTPGEKATKVAAKLRRRLSTDP